MCVTWIWTESEPELWLDQRWKSDEITVENTLIDKNEELLIVGRSFVDLK